MHLNKLLLLLLTSVAVLGIDPKDVAVQARAEISSPTSITLTWLADASGTATNYTISRIREGEQSFKTITSLAGTNTTFVDVDVVPGVRYEYEILRRSKNHTGVGYVYSGIDIPATEARNVLILITERAVATELQPELTRLMQDLEGDGWTVLREDVDRDGTVESIQSLIESHCRENPDTVKSVFLFGHVPVPYSGFIVPDGHNPDHLGAWPADVRYACEGAWTDTRARSIAPNDLRNQNLPGDGKFDQSTLPGAITLQLGRVDLSSLPSSELSEVELLRQYLNKNHSYRHGQEKFLNQGILYDGFGFDGGESFAANGWRNFAPLFGPFSTHEVRFEEFLPTLQNSTFLFGYACGPGTYASLLGVGTSSDVLRAERFPAFSMLFGSYFGDWDSTDNFLRAALATKSGGLASCWAGRPSWYFHHMALGEPIGYSALITQGNAGRYRLPGYGSQMVHVALLGDPTLRLHVVAPPSKLAGRVRSGSVILSWEQSADAVDGYHIYRLNRSGSYIRLNSKPVFETVFEDETARASGPVHTYMVKAEKLETRGGGSYHNLSQGVFLKISASNLRKRRRF